MVIYYLYHQILSRHYLFVLMSPIVFLLLQRYRVLHHQKHVGGVRLILLEVILLHQLLQIYYFPQQFLNEVKFVAADLPTHLLHVQNLNLFLQCLQVSPIIHMLPQLGVLITIHVSAPYPRDILLEAFLQCLQVHQTHS